MQLESSPPTLPEFQAPAQMAESALVRQAFEAWATDDSAWPRAVERQGDGYKFIQTQAYWESWQAAVKWLRSTERLSSEHSVQHL